MGSYHTPYHTAPTCAPLSYLTLAAAPQKFIHMPDIPVETAVRLYRRYLKLEPTHAEEYVAYLKAKVRHPVRRFTACQLCKEAACVAGAVLGWSLGCVVE